MSAAEQAPEPECIRLLAQFLAKFAGRQETRRDGAEHEQIATLTQDLARLAAERDGLSETLAAAREAIARQTKELETERLRRAELQRAAEEQRERWLAAEQQISALEERIVTKNGQLRDAERENDALAQARDELLTQLNELRAAHDRLRAEHESATAPIGDIGPAAPAPRAGDILAALWERLAQANPLLVLPSDSPTPEAAERLVDTFVEFARFTRDLDQTMQPFLERFTRHHQKIARDWVLYARQTHLHELIQQITDEPGRPASLLKMRLLFFRRWIFAATVGGDSALECIGGELDRHLRAGLMADPNRKIKDYLHKHEPDVFQQRICELRSQKLAAAYENGV